MAVITLNRPDARNAIGAEMLKQLHSILQGMRHATSARVLIVCSTVPGVFCAGADLKVPLELSILIAETFCDNLASTGEGNVRLGVSKLVWLLKAALSSRN